MIAIVAGIGAVCLVVVGVLFALKRGLSPAGVTIPVIPDQEISELQTLDLTIPHRAKLRDGEQLRFAIESPIEGLKIDASSGRLTWTPTAEQGPRTYPVAVLALVSDQNAARQDFKISVLDANRPPEVSPIPEQMTDGQQLVSLNIVARDPDRPSRALRYQLLGGAPPEAHLDAQSGKFEWKPTSSAASMYRVNVAVQEQGRGGLSSRATLVIRVGSQSGATGQPDLADSGAGIMPAMPAPSTKPSSETAPKWTGGGEPGDRTEDELLTMFREKRLFQRKEYPALRKLFADRFERAHAAEIKQALGADFDEVQAWFADHPEAREEFFIAIDPQRDKIPTVFSIFNQLRKEFPDRFADYTQLAIATAVVWDDEGVIDNLEGNARRSKATVPSDRLDVLGNFKYLVDAEPMMQGRVQYAPWEFLTHLVNQKTPRAEREWAMQNFVNRRVQIGKCYSDVPYDYLMLNSGDAQARLNGMQYTLPNLLQYGGVCSNQADFAARVSKSIGAPAEMVVGDGSDGEGHAWIMWVELSHMTKENVGFTLQSHGRYRAHNYYVGHLTDPQTGQSITDRQLELRLHTAGSDLQAKRHADLAMRASEIILAQEDVTLKQRFEYLAAVIDLCPGNENAWHSIAQLAKENSGDKQITKHVTGAIQSMFAVFVAFPDFTWEIFDDLVSYDANIRTRMNLISRLLAMYEQAGRPDLASKACLELADYLVEDERKTEAIDALAHAVMAFPNESTITPPLLDRLEALCEDTKDAAPRLARFYADFLPRIPPLVDGKRPSPHCMQMLERAAKRFRDANQVELAQAADAQLATLKAMKPPKE